MTELTAYQRWYANHKKELSEKRKKRYQEDPVYRQACLDRKAKQVEARRGPPVDPQYTHNLTQAAEELDVTLWALRSWRDKGYIPEPHAHHKGLYFTTAQVGLMKLLAKFFSEVGRASLTPEQEAEVQQISDLIRANWV